MSTVLGAAFAVAAAGDPAGRREPRAVSEAALEAHVRFLADDALEGRETGAAGYELAALYVAAQFRAMGLAPAGTGGGYLQEVPLRESRLVEEAAALELRRSGKRERLSSGKDFVVLPNVHHEASEAAGPVVFVGHGIYAPELGHDDFAGIDLRGKLALAVSGAPASFPADQRAYYTSYGTKREMAAAKGAVGALMVWAPDDPRRVPWDRLVRFAGRPNMDWVGPGGAPADAAPSIRASAVLSDAGAEKLLRGSGTTLATLFEVVAAGRHASRELPVVARLAQRSRHSSLVSWNVAGRLAGSDPALRDEHVVYTAHLDHVGIGPEVDGDRIYNGAYDNAMGVSVLIESARALTALEPAPRRSMLFVAVTAEEKGLIGSEYFVAHPSVAGRLVANVNLDMPIFIYPPADLVAFGSNHSTLETTVARAAAASGFTLSPDPMPEEVIFIRSDQYSFVRAGIPAVMLVTGNTSADPAVDGARAQAEFLKMRYHKPSDEASLPVDWPAARRFARANVLVGLEVADADEPPRWNAGDFFGDRFAGGTAGVDAAAQ